jgi:hypothetical protein
MHPSSLSATTKQIQNSNAAATTRPQEIAADDPVSFVREHWLRLSIVSVLVLVPCFWHSRLAAGDLGSHLYNAWVVQQIEHGRLPGLWIARQWNNVLFDFLLSGFASIVSLHVAEMIAVSLSVLIFFWGLFAFICAATRRAPWTLVPVIAVFIYGWTFQQGFFNYYLSLGLAFIGLAVFWSRRGWKRLLALAVAPFIFLAHPLGFAWLFGGAMYIAIAEILPHRLHLLLVLAAVAVLGGTHQFFWHHYRVRAPAHTVPFYNGLDQMLFTNRYLIPVGAFGVFLAIAVAVDLLRRRHDRDYFSAYAIPLELYLVTEAGVLFLPDAVYWPQYAAPTSSLTARYTLISAALLCCLLGAAKPRRWHWLGVTGVALVFFTFLYQDTSVLYRIQEQAQRLVHSVPPGERILVTIENPLKYRFSTKHIIDEACVGYCFMYGNYEVPSLQFRVRALPGNHYVMTRVEEATAIENGEYTVQPQDLPASQIYQCGPIWMDLCIHSLQAGERNDRLGSHLDLGIYPDRSAKPKSIH